MDVSTIIETFGRIELKGAQIALNFGGFANHLDHVAEISRRLSRDGLPALRP